MVDEDIGKNEKLYPILDSRLILTTLPKVYDIKLVDCGSYKQIYLYSNGKVKRPNKKDDNDLNLKKIKFDIELKDSKKNADLKSIDNIELKNIIRSKLKCQRIAKCNMEDWKSFITLTFSENISNVNYANKRFRYYIDKVQRVHKGFKYLCITEFQKRGATHYHLLTNIPCDSKLIPKRKKLKLWNSEIKSYKEIEYYNLPYWLDGFSSAEPIKNDSQKVIGYISKYMTKDIDNRLFNKHRYFYSRNLNVPKVNYIDLTNIKDYEFLIKKVRDKNLIYQNKYVNSYDNSKVSFLELQ